MLLQNFPSLSDHGLALVHDLDIITFRSLWSPEDDSGSTTAYFLSFSGKRDFFRGNEFLAIAKQKDVIERFRSSYTLARSQIDPLRNPEKGLSTGRMSVARLGALTDELGNS